MEEKTNGERIFLFLVVICYNLVMPNGKLGVKFRDTEHVVSERHHR